MGLQMNIVIWMLAGAILGWVGYSFLGFNEARGRMVSIVIGAIGGFFGGKMIAPMFTVAPVTADFNLSALFFAVAVAGAFLAVGNLVYERWGV
jgi:uncharacterized membrane protein YeaQ/YmgE (transglycosylase-associated protein family)